MSRRVATASLALFLVLLAGCSGSKGSFIGLKTTTTVGTSAPTVSVTAGPTTTNSNPYCQFLTTFNDQFGKINTGLTDPTQFKMVMQQAAASVQQAQATAPADIKADLKTIGDAFQQLLGVFAAANYDITKVSLNSLQQLSSPSLVGAANRVDAYTKSHCL